MHQPKPSRQRRPTNETGEPASALGHSSRVAQELHDTVAQLLFAIGANAQLALEEEPLTPPVREALETIVRLSGEAGHDLRTAFQGLGAPRAVAFGLGEALEELVAARRAQGDLTIRLEVADDLLAADDAVAELLYRICREGLSNVERHAEATRCVVRCASDGAWATALVEDDGVGFEPPASGEHFGLAFLREAVEALGGSFDVRRGWHVGTRLSVRVPLPDGTASVSFDRLATVRSLDQMRRPRRRASGDGASDQLVDR